MTETRVSIGHPISARLPDADASGRVPPGKATSAGPVDAAGVESPAFEPDRDPAGRGSGEPPRPHGRQVSATTRRTPPKSLSRRYRAPRGVCSSCARSVALNSDGTCRGHGWRDQGHNTEWCKGSRLPPRKEGEDE